MEENDLLQPEASMFDVTISPSVAYSLKETCRWAALFAYIAGSLLLIVILAFAVGWSYVSRLPLFDQFGGYAAGLVAGMVIVFGICLGLLALLLVFCRKVKKGLEIHNLQMVEEGTASLKLYFTISGALSALLLAFGVLGLIRTFLS